MCIGDKKEPLHRVILTTFVGKSSGHSVDHINRIRHDNRLSNLRWATRSEQMLNRDWNA